MRNMQKALALVLALVMTLGLSVSAMADWAKDDYKSAAVIKTMDEIAADLTGKTVILHTNDVHGYIDNYAKVTALKAELVKRGAEVIMVDAGDYSNGNTYVVPSMGGAAVEMMNAAGYEVVTLGNHEFDFGREQLMTNMADAKFTVVCANVLDKDGKLLFDANKTITTASGLKIGFFGLETPETYRKVTPSFVSDLTIYKDSELYKCAQEQVDALKDDDLVIGLFHLGVDGESVGVRSVDVYQNTTGIDMIIDGHSHTVMTTTEKGEPIQSTGEYLENIGVIVIDNETKKIEDNFLIATKILGEDGKTVVSELDKDETVDAAAQKIIAAVKEEYGTVIGKTEVDLLGERADVRSHATNLGNLVADALLWSVLNGDEKLTVDDDHVVAITNGGGIRASVATGDITKDSMIAVCPFITNIVAVVYVSGETLLTALEAATAYTPVGAYPQTSGIKFTVDNTKEFVKGEEYPTGYFAPASINRVNIESVNGQDFDPEATYAVVTNSFVADGGDAYYAFKAEYQKDGGGFDTGIVMNNAMIDYIVNELGGVVTAEKYGTVRDDETIIPDPLAAYTDLDAAQWYAAAARYVIGSKTMTGTSDTTFEPNTAVTRAMVMTLLARMSGVDTTGGDTWYAKGLAWAVENGVSDGSNPTGTITREQFATMLYRYVKEVKGEDVTEDEVPIFPDSSEVSSWAFDAMSWATSKQIINGSDGKLLPGSSATRIQVAQMLLNYSKLAPAA